MKLYMAVTTDEYELPLCVTETCAELVQFTGRPKSHVLTLLSRGTKTCAGFKLVRVEIDDDERLI